MGNVTLGNLDEVFKHHPPAGDFQIEQYHKIRKAAKVAARGVLEATTRAQIFEALVYFEHNVRVLTGDCRDRESAIAQINVARLCLQVPMQLVDVADEAHANGGELPLPDAETLQHVITNIRGAVMWANASVALKGSI